MVFFPVAAEGFLRRKGSAMIDPGVKLSRRKIFCSIPDCIERWFLVENLKKTGIRLDKSGNDAKLNPRAASGEGVIRHGALEKKSEKNRKTV